jgi:hypothetical protein
MLRSLALLALFSLGVFAGELEEKGYQYGSQDMDIELYYKETPSGEFAIAFRNRSTKTLTVRVHVRERNARDGSTFSAKPGISYATQTLRGITAAYQPMIVSVQAAE